ncbi:MAG: energy-coupling factor ABC transporter ATP-binding protein [Clostridiales bacterium]|jgi:cobalt/nickel transport system ATP-binding protein|nr:energy-coupling factor ABC transporter ATP-binding protein [Clostridiales bacterium]
MEHLIKVHCLRHIYPDKTEVNICGLDFVVKPGERVVVLGPNGAGKTTLLSHILGLLKPVEGQVEVLGMQPHKHFNQVRKHIGVVFQNVDEQIIGPRVLDDIAFSLRNEGFSRQQVEEKVGEIAAMLGIEDILNKIPHYLSGGQKKKVALAGAISMMPEILILDEPFNGLDPKSKDEMIDLLNRLNQEKGITLVITTHDINIVPDIADIIYVINKGSIVTKGSLNEVFGQADLLREANLQLPVLMELFDRLRKKGYSLELPANLDDAEAQLEKILSPDRRDLD